MIKPPFLLLAGLGALSLSAVSAQSDSADANAAAPAATPVTPQAESSAPGTVTPAPPTGLPPGITLPKINRPKVADVVRPDARPKAIPVAPVTQITNLPAGQVNTPVNAPDPTATCEVALQFPKLTGEDLSFLYHRLTGRRVVIAAEATKLELYFVQPPPITYGQAIDLLKAACLMQGFVFVPGGNDWDKLVSASQGPKPSSVGKTPLITHPQDLPVGDEVVQYVMTLKHIKPDEATRIFQSVVVQLNAFGSIVPVPNSSALVITENSSLIRSLIDLLAQVDKPAYEMETKFISVQYADVETLATTLTELFTAQKEAQSTATGVQRVAPAPAGNNPAANPAAANAGAAGQGGGTADSPPAQIIPDSRTNRIFIMARPIDLLLIEGLIREFDTKTDDRNFMRRKLRFLPVGGFLSVAENALTRAYGAASNATGAPGAGGTAGAQGGGAAAAPARAQQSTSMGRNSNSRNSSSNGLNSGVGGFGNGSGSGTGGSGGGLSAPQTDTSPQSMLIGRTFLVADNITNSIIVQGPPASLEIINNLLDEIDVKADQVMVSTVFGQLNLNDSEKYGFNWLQKLNNDSTGTIAGGIGSPLPDVATNNNNVFNTEGAFSGGLGVYGTIGNYFAANIKALESTGKFNIISRPTIFMANNQKAMISSGKQIAVPTSSYNGTSNSGFSTNIEYRDVQLALEVIPLINSQDEITLQISLVSQDLAESTRKVGDTDTNDIISRELLTTVTVPNNQTVVLGGLIIDSESKSKSGVPILKNIPGIGALFRSSTTTKNRDELLIFIQPKIIRDQATMKEGQTDVHNRFDLATTIQDHPDMGDGAPKAKAIDEAEDKKSAPKKMIIIDGPSKGMVPSASRPGKLFSPHR